MRRIGYGAITGGRSAALPACYRSQDHGEPVVMDGHQRMVGRNKGVKRLLQVRAGGIETMSSGLLSGFATKRLPGTS